MPFKPARGTYDSLLSFEVLSQFELFTSMATLGPLLKEQCRGGKYTSVFDASLIGPMLYITKTTPLIYAKFREGPLLPYLYV